MKTFLMCEPRYFEVSYVINPWMAGNQGLVDKKLADRQWQNLHEVLSSSASIKLIPPAEDLPDMVFTANAGFISRPRQVIVSTFRHSERQPESPYFNKFFEESGYSVTNLGNIKFEGAGDALYDSNGQIWMGHGPRSDVEATARVATLCHAQVTGLALVDPRWYHLDTAFCPLVNGYAIAYDKAFSTDSVYKINKAFGNQVIWISDEDAHNFACNAVNIGKDIILHKASDKLKAELRNAGFNIIEVDVSEFLKAGGACKCLTLEL